MVTKPLISATFWWLGSSLRCEAARTSVITFFFNLGLGLKQIHRCSVDRIVPMGRWIILPGVSEGTARLREGTNLNCTYFGIMYWMDKVRSFQTRRIIPFASAHQHIKDSHRAHRALKNLLFPLRTSNLKNTIAKVSRQSKECLQPEAMTELYQDSTEDLNVAIFRLANNLGFILQGVLLTLGTLWVWHVVISVSISTLIECWSRLPTYYFCG